MKLANAVKGDSLDLVMAAFPHATEEEKSAALSAAVRRFKEHAVQYLLTYGVTPSEDDLMCVVHCQHYDLVERLLGYGAPTHNFAGPSPLIVATRMGDLQMVQVLLNGGVAVDVVDIHSYTALRYAVSSGHVKIATTLVNAGASVAGLENFAVKAIYIDADEILDLLLTAGIDVKQLKGDNGKPILLHAVRESRDQVIEVMLKHGVEVNVEESDGRSALFYAIAKNRPAVAKMLVARGASTYFRDCHRNMLMEQNGAALLESIRSTGKATDEADILLLLAAKRGDAHNVEIFLNDGADVNARDSTGKCALYYAIMSRSVDAVRALLERGAETNVDLNTFLHLVNNNDMKLMSSILRSTKSWSKEGKAALDNAFGYTVRKGNIEFVHEMLKGGADVNCRKLDGRTPLMMAAERGNTKMARMLIEFGARVNAYILKGHTAVMFAAECNDMDMVKLLIDAGANLEMRNKIRMKAFDKVKIKRPNAAKLKQMMKDAEDENNYKAIDLSYFPVASDIKFDKAKWDDVHKAAEHIMPNEDVGYGDDIDRLLGGEKLYRSDEFGRTVLMFCACYNFTRFSHHLAIRGVDLDAMDAKGMTALTWAVLGASIDNVILLLNEGAEKDTVDLQGRTAMFHAIRLRNVQCCEYLAKQDACIVEGRSYHQLQGALVWAASTGSALILNVLLGVGMLNNQLDEHGRNALMVAAAGGHEECVIRLLGAFPFDHNLRDKNGHTALWHALQARQLATFHLLVKGGADTRAVAHSRPALSVAAREGLTDFVKVLLEAGADMSLYEPDGTTPLMHAAMGDYSDMARLLLGYKVDVRAINMKAETALLYATQRNDGDMVKALIKAGAYVNQFDCYGDTPLHVAAHGCLVDALVALVQGGADIYLKDTKGRDPMQIVLEGGQLTDDGRAECAEMLIAWGAQCEHLAGVAEEVARYLESKKAEKNKKRTRD